MKITNMKCNRITNPLGFTLGQPRLSWVTEAPSAKMQTFAQVQVSLGERFVDILYDSGKSKNVDSLGFILPMALEPCTRYYWRVLVWTEKDQEVQSPIAWFETAKMQEPWSAQWITPDWEDKSIHPLLRRSFHLEGKVTSARVYVSGLGLYELALNGQRVGDEYLTPYCNAYDKWIQYQTFDVTALLQTGENVIGAMLGNGWYKGRFGFNSNGESIYGDTFALLCELVVRYTDGQTIIVSSDEAWKATAGPILQGNIYDGEVYDANKAITDWSCTGLDDGKWSDVRLLDIGFECLEARRSIPVKIKEEMTPVHVIETPKGETVLDMGQNMVGWIRFAVHAPKGTEIYLQYGEEMQEGCFYRENLRTAKAEFLYVSDGQPAVVHPRFTFYGFRYVKVEGWYGAVDLKDFTGCVVYSDMDTTGSIETSNPLVNRLIQNAIWGQKGNFLDVPTDCPQRDERMGWTGDAQVFSGTACFNMDVNAFFHKFLYDLAMEQNESGMVPHVIPSFGIGKGTENGFLSGGSTVWGDAATVIPWNLYLHYGDKVILEQQFESMKGWVDYIRKQDDGSRIWRTGFHFGDWLALDGLSAFNPFGGTPNDLIASAFYAYSAELVGKAAAVIGKDSVAQDYLQLANEVREGIQVEFLSPRGRLAVDTQTAYVLALFLDLVPTQFRARVADTLQQKLEENNNHLKTGFVGTPYLCRVLSENGYNDLAYRLLMNEDFPGWLYQVKLGATTIWERWNSLLPDGKFSELGMNSLNHYAYGSILEWIYRNVCGLNPVETSPGFSRVRLAPQPYGLLRWAQATLDSASGRFISCWRIDEDGLHFTFSIPFNVTADLVLPDAEINAVTVNGKHIVNANLSAREQNGNVSAILTTGDYSIHYVPTKEYILRYSSESSLLDLMANTKTKAVLRKHLPQLVERAEGGQLMGMRVASSLRVIAKHPLIPISQELLDALDMDLEGVAAWD